MPFNPQLAALITERLNLARSLDDAVDLTPEQHADFRQQLWNVIDSHERGHLSIVDTLLELRSLQTRVSARAARP
jgi:hypothetical protein